MAVEKYWLDITDINDLITKDKSGRSIIDVNRLQEQEEQDRKKKRQGKGKHQENKHATSKVAAVLIVIIPVYSSSIYNILHSTFLSLLLIALPSMYGLTRVADMEEYLQQGVEQAVVEFETLKKILIVEFPIASIIIAFNIIAGIINIPMGKTWWSSPLGFVTFSDIMVPIISAVMGGLYMYGGSISKKEFRFYLSKTCFTTALHKKDIFKQMYYFGLGLQEYNKYLKRHLKHQIKDIDKIFSKVSLLDNETKTKVICSLSDSFKTENDKLKPIKYISSELMKSEDIESFLVPESLKSQLKVVGTFLTASIPIVISIITLLSRFLKNF